MSSLNKVTLIGNVGRDPEIRRTQNGDAVVSFSLATSESWRDKATGERKEKSEWHNVVIWNEHIGKVAEQYVKKGSKVYVEGQMQTRKWQDKDGIDRYSTEVVVPRFKGELVLLGERAGGDDERPARQTQRQAPAQPVGQHVPLDDSIPFEFDWR